MLVAIPTVVNHEYVHQCIDAVIDHDLLIIRNGPVSLEQYSDKTNVTIYDPGENLGVAASWNYACNYAWEHGYPGVLIINDDVMIDSDVSFLESYDPTIFWRIEGYAAFYMSRYIWDTVGPFDEGYWPAYYEDCDHGHRVGLKGIVGVDANSRDDFQVQFRHGHAAWEKDQITPYGRGGAGNSSKANDTIQDLVERSFLVNQQRFVSKWGGMPGYQTNQYPEYVVPTKWIIDGETIFYHDLIIHTCQNQVVGMSSQIDLKETHIAWELLRPGDRAVVAGAGRGSTVAAVAAKLGSANVAAFEISHDLVEYCREHFFITRGDKPIGPRIHAYGLWSEATRGIDKGGGHFQPTDDGPITCLDTSAILHGSGATALILDVEGAEYQILPSINLDRLRVLVVEFHYGDPGPELERIEKSGLEIKYKDYYTPEVLVVGAVRP